MDFNVTEYKKCIDMDSDSTLQLSLRNYHLLRIYVTLKKNIHNYLEKTIKIFLFSNYVYVRPAIL